MGNQNTINVQLIVKDDGSVVMKQFGQNSENALNQAGNAATKTTSTFDKLKGSYLEFAAKAATAYMAISKAMEYMDLGAKAAQAEASFRMLATTSGVAADQLIANMKRATNGTIDDSQLMQKAVKAMMLDFSADQIDQMAEMARLAARTSGDSVGEAFDNIVDAISTNMPKTLKKYGLITKEQMNTVTQAMSEGVTGINLGSIAWSNYGVQIAKIGPLQTDEAEKLQQHRAELEATREIVGELLLTVAGWAIKGASALTEPFAALAASAATLSTAPLVAYLEKLFGIETEEQKIATNSLAAAKEKKRQEDEIMLAELAAVAQKKATLETMKALNKDYFTSQEANIKAMTEIIVAAGGDEYKATLESLKKRDQLNAEYYARTKKEIDLEASARIEADRKKISDEAYKAQKIQVLDTETNSKAIAMYQQKTQAAVQAAQNDIKSLTSRLGEYQTYYDSLKAKMDKNIADEKQHFEELKALRQQSMDLDKSAAAQLALINGTDKKMTSQQRYESGRSSLNQQYMDVTNNMTGQDQVKALDEYRQAVTALQQQFAQGVQGPNDIFGKPQDIISAAKVAEDASSDINRALALQKSTVADLTTAKQQQMEADQQQAQQAQADMQKTQAEMEKLKGLIFDISTQIQNMQKTIELTGIDKVSSVVDGIIARIQQLHALAAQPIVMTTTMGGSNGSGLNLDPLVLGSYATGTDYVPRTGPYQLHQGEKVTPAGQNRSSSNGVNITGDIIITIPTSAAPQRPEDWRMITRNYIMPEMRKLMH